MLIANLLPLLANYSLGFDLVAGPDDTVTLTVIPRKAEGAKHGLESGETRPISITATACPPRLHHGRASLLLLAGQRPTRSIRRPRQRETL